MRDKITRLRSQHSEFKSLKFEDIPLLLQNTAICYQFLRYDRSVETQKKNHFYAESTILYVCKSKFMLFDETCISYPREFYQVLTFHVYVFNSFCIAIIQNRSYL